MVMKGWMAVVAAIGVSGCTPAHWTKAGGNAAQFEHDKAECIYEGSKATASDQNMFAGLMVNDLAAQCLKLKGYTQTRGGDDMAEARAKAAANEKAHPIADQKAQQMRDLKSGQ